MGSRRSRRGVSVIAVLVMLAIATVVAAAALPVSSASTPREKLDETRSEMTLLVGAIQDYFWDCRCFPATFAHLQTNVSALDAWRGPYALPTLSTKNDVSTSFTQDAWNRVYVVTDTTTGLVWTPASTTSSITIASGGPDQIDGTADDVKRIVDVTFMRRKETADEIRILDISIAKYNAAYLDTAPLPPDLDTILAALYDANLLPRPPVGTTDSLRRDGWGSDYLPSPDVTPVTAVVSAHP